MQSNVLQKRHRINLRHLFQNIDNNFINYFRRSVSKVINIWLKIYSNFLVNHRVALQAALCSRGKKWRLPLSAQSFKNLCSDKSLNSLVALQQTCKAGKRRRRERGREYGYRVGREGGTRDGTSQDFSDSSHSSRVGVLTRNSRVRAKSGDRGLIFLLSVAKALNINILDGLLFVPWIKVDKKVKLIFELGKIYWLDSNRTLRVRSNRVIFWAKS